ncbi:mercury(II) reductase [Paenibacillus alginolyticus]|uniref:mercury(II) reductase n=1 Tax=Paenibacillus alginolyticus TaxID=59839 RepID=UPI000413F4EA|nr:mercury(II) reductase [Paenibacillus alginolyticus]MCY9667614.1 mercury(II) reductase [Paenibacillus alginolyticus]
MKKYRINVQGMTCSGCEEHVSTALKNIGAANIETSFHRNEVTFELPDDVAIETAQKAINEAKYQSGDAEVIETHDAPFHGDEDDYDFLIIGSGGAAFSAAIQAVEYGAKVAIIERGTVGGTCVNVGCVPSKTLLRAGEINHLAKSNPFLGLATSTGKVDLEKLVEHKNELVASTREQKYEHLIGEYGFELIRGEATFADEKTIEVSGRKVTAKRFLIATGASPSIPDIQGLMDVAYLTSTSLLELKQLPKTLAVIGSGYIALELGQLFHNLGSDVTLMQRSPRILKEYDLEISEAVTKAITEQGIHLITGVTYDRIEANSDLKQVHISVDGEKKVIEVEQLLIATGRKPNIEALNLNAANVNIGFKGEIVVDDFLNTSNPRIYAAGDVTMGPQFVYVAAYEGRIAADNAIGGLEKKVNLEAVPGVTFTSPSVATVGLTEEQAKAKGYEVKTSILPLDSVPRALVNRETTGVFKLVADSKSLTVLGVHIVAENAGDVIYAATLAVKFGLTVEDLRDSLAPYLTMAEGLKLAALTINKDVSKLSCCAG